MYNTGGSATALTTGDSDDCGRLEQGSTSQSQEHVKLRDPMSTPRRQSVRLLGALCARSSFFRHTAGDPQSREGEKASTACRHLASSPSPDRQA
jgi:hypothetical protein